MQYGFGVDLGGTTVKIAYFNTEGTLLEKWEIPTDTRNAGAGILGDIAASVKQFVAQRGISREKLIGIGIGVPGAVDAEGVVHGCDNLGWGTFSVKNTLSDLTGLPVEAGNDANMAALGECWKGGGRGFRNMVLVTLGTGVGGGIVTEGKLVVGTNGAAGEIGHITLCREEQEPCSCGKYGCAEQYCSATGIVRLARREMDSCDTPSCLRQLKALTAKDVFDGAKEKDPLAQVVVSRYFTYMGEFLANICCVVDPEVMVIGGGVSKAGEFLLKGIQEAFLRFAYHAHRDTCFALATLGNDAGAYGAFKRILG